MVQQDSSTNNQENKITVNLHLWVRETIGIKQRKQKNEGQERQSPCMQAGNESCRSSADIGD